MAGLMLFLLLVATQAANALPEQGIFTATLNKENKYMFGVHKSMYNNSKIAINIVECISSDSTKDLTLNIGWLLRMSPCAEEYIDVEFDKNRLAYYNTLPEYDQTNMGYKTVSFKRSANDASSSHLCQKHQITLKDESGSPYETRDALVMEGNGNDTQAVNAGQQKAIEKKGNMAGEPISQSRKRRDAASEKTTVSPAPAGNGSKPLGKPGDSQLDTVYHTWEDGIYLLILTIEDVAEADFNVSVKVTMTGSYGYLSAIDWPLLPFYGVMCGIYLIYGIIWLFLSFCNWRDLLRIQFWIGGVIFLGMLEKAVFFAEYEKINSTGQSVRGAVVFAELVSCLKRTLARMLVVIVSLGFGIVKPRLGPMLHRVLGMGALYMILGSVEGVLRVTKHKSDTSRQALLASIPLAVLDAAICWWVFTSLVQTTRTLRLRRNLVKLSLYRHFTNTLIFAVLASIAFMIWSIKQHKMITCLSDWKEIWVDDAFWHLLFSVILLVIMVLWRPTANNQRYAFSPLLDAADDEAEEPMLNEAFDGMKMRGAGKQGSTSPKQRGDPKSKADEDLKWIEENIPTSVTDTALPSLLDSDEEIMTTKFEMSKME